MAQFQLVRIVNKGDKDIVDHYNSERFLIRAKDDAGTFVPWDAMVIWFGNPLVVNKPGNPARDNEVTRIHTRYGGYGDLAAWEANRPNVECYTTDGERIYTAMEDVEGQRIAFKSPELTAQEARDAEVAQMSRAIAEMQVAMALLQQQKEGGEAADELPDDTPNTVPVGPRTGSLESSKGAPAKLKIRKDDELPQDDPQ